MEKESLGIESEILRAWTYVYNNLRKKKKGELVKLLCTWKQQGGGLEEKGKQMRKGEKEGDRTQGDIEARAFTGWENWAPSVKMSWRRNILQRGAWNSIGNYFVVTWTFLLFAHATKIFTEDNYVNNCFVWISLLCRLGKVWWARSDHEKINSTGVWKKS